MLYLYCDGGQIVLRFAVTFPICAMVKYLANLGMLSSWNFVRVPKSMALDTRTKFQLEILIKMQYW